LTSSPAFSRCKAADRPPMPPPMMVIFMLPRHPDRSRA
jgi:hypothetical protein